MASLLKFVECSVCFDVFCEPQSLFCRHTFCRSCVDQIKGSSKIECPLCKTFSDVSAIRPDHEKVSLVDEYNQQQLQTQPSAPPLEDSSSSVTQICEQCQQRDRAVVSFCTDCQQHMCQQCQFNHKQIPATTNHKVLTLSEIEKTAAIRADLRKQQQQLKKKQSELQQWKQQAVRSAINLTHTHDTAVADIEQRLNQHIEHFEKMKNKVIAAKDKAVANIRKDESQIDQSLRELEAKLQQVTKLIDSKDDLSVNASHVRVSEGAELSIASASSLHLPGLHLEFSVTVGDNHYTPVTINVTQSQSPLNTSHKISNVNTNIESDVNFYDLCHNVFRKERTVKLDSEVSYVSHVKNRLICTLPKGIVICSAETLQTLESLSFDNISSANCTVLTDSSSYLVSSNDTGLSEVDSRGKQLCLIHPGECVSVSRSADRYYSYSEDKGCVLCVRRCAGDAGWETLSQTRLQQDAGVSVETVWGCVVVRGHIYVSWWGERSGEGCDSVSKHSMSGQLLTRHGEDSDISGGSLFIGGVDGAGRVLVCDFWNQRLQVCSEGGEWRVVAGITQVQGEPRTAAVAGNTVWVGCGGWRSDFFLHKYVFT